jgi:hypothetical protein
MRTESSDGHPASRKAHQDLIGKGVGLQQDNGRGGVQRDGVDESGTGSVLPRTVNFRCCVQSVNLELIVVIGFSPGSHFLEKVKWGRRWKDQVNAGSQMQWQLQIKSMVRQTPLRGHVLICVTFHQV